MIDFIIFDHVSKRQLHYTETTTNRQTAMTKEKSKKKEEQDSQRQQWLAEESTVGVGIAPTKNVLVTTSCGNEFTFLLDCAMNADAIKRAITKVYGTACYDQTVFNIPTDEEPVNIDESNDVILNLDTPSPSLYMIVDESPRWIIHGNIFQKLNETTITTGSKLGQLIHRFQFAYASTTSTVESGLTEGQSYWEIKLELTEMNGWVDCDCDCAIGVARVGLNTNHNLLRNTDTWLFRGDNNRFYGDQSDGFVCTNENGIKLKSGDRVGVLVDMQGDDGCINFFVNGRRNGGFQGVSGPVAFVVGADPGFKFTILPDAIVPDSD